MSSVPDTSALSLTSLPYPNHRLLARVESCVAEFPCLAGFYRKKNLYKAGANRKWPISAPATAAAAAAAGAVVAFKSTSYSWNAQFTLLV